MTPRRILLLVGGLVAFGVAYFLYARFFGSVDGLPVLPERMLVMGEGTIRPQERTSTPTLEILRLGFGENAPETNSGNYTLQLEFRQTNSSIVIAAGTPPANPNSERVEISPFSAVIYRKPRPAHLRQPGEVAEISTIHADKAVLEFDRKIQTAVDMNNANLIRLELISDPEHAIEDALGRRGRVHVTNNQRSADPNKHLTLKTVGPVFYHDHKADPKSPASLGPDIWTDAPVEIVDLGNIPQRADSREKTAPALGEQVRNSAVVADILAGRRLPPPTLTAVGFRVYLESSQPAAKRQSRDDAGIGNVRRVELLEKVVMNLWVAPGQGFVGAGGPPPAAATPSSAAFAIGGGLVPGTDAARALARELLQVETRGPFFYDSEKNLARFDVLPLADPNLPNDVQVTKVPPQTGTQTLFSQVLELEFSNKSVDPLAKQPRDAQPTQAGAGRLKKLHAWTYTPGRVVSVLSDPDDLRAYGTDLVHENDASRTQLTGAPLYAIQQRNVLNAGSAKEPAVLVMEPAPEQPVAKPGEPPANRRMQATVRGFGRVEMFDAAAGANTVTASWRTSMVQTTERINDQALDLYTLTDDAKFEDVKADYWLKGNVLKLWLTQPPRTETTPTQPTGPVATRGQPHRLQAIGNVTGHSADIDIEQSDQLNTWFREGSPAVAVAAPATPSPVPTVAPTRPEPKGPVPPVAMGNPPPKQAEKPKPPTTLRARVIDTWVVRQPVPNAPPTSPLPAEPASERTAPGMKYQLEKARCDGMVSVHQDPADPTKPQGTDILGSLMVIEGSPEGNILTVFGWDNRPGEVHNEGTHLVGPKVVVDQLHNVVIVEGRGSLAMPTSSDLTGATLKNAEVVVVHFKDGMKFQGALKRADFFGKVNASQGGSWVACHTLQVNFDRPVYLTQANRPGAAPKVSALPPGNGSKTATEEKPKIDKIYCYPAPADAADTPRDREVWFTQIDRDLETGKVIRHQRLRAYELTLKAQARDPGGSEPYREILAEGPGTVRTWQVGAKDEFGQGGAAPKQPGAAPADESEMKLTIVTFNGRMTAQDKGRTYQSATFLESIQVIQVPTQNPDLEVDPHRLPKDAVHLTCASQLVVWAHRKGNEPAHQHMVATGNAYIQNETYDGWGETITLEGKVVTLRGEESLPARIKGRFKGDDQIGKMIIFDRATNHYEVKESIDGTISPPPPTPKTPMPKGPVPKKK